MTGHDLELNESVPDLVVESGRPPPPLPPALPGSPSQPPPFSRRDAAIALGFLVGPVTVAFIVRLVTSRDSWSPIWQLWMVALIALLMAGWFLARSDKLRAAHASSEHVRIRDLEAEVLPATIGIAIAVIAEIVLVASFELGAGEALIGLLVAWILLCFLPPLRRFEGTSFVHAACSPEEAFALLSDPQSWRLWTTELEMIEASEVPVRVGTLVHSRVRVEGRLLEGDERVVVFDPPRRCATEVLDVRGAASDIYEIAATGGGTLITYTYRSLAPPEQAVLGGPFLFQRNSFKQRWKRKMQRIKQLLEEGAASSV